MIPSDLFEQIECFLAEVDVAALDMDTCEGELLRQAMDLLDQVVDPPAARQPDPCPFPDADSRN